MYNILFSLVKSCQKMGETLSLVTLQCTDDGEKIAPSTMYECIQFRVIAVLYIFMFYVLDLILMRNTLWMFYMMHFFTQKTITSV